MAGKFTPDRAATRAYLVGAGGVLPRLVARTLRQTRSVAVARAPVRTGRLRNSITITPIKTRGLKVRGSVVAKVSYGLAVHEGTRPHLITARNGRALAFPGRGGTPATGGLVFRRSVMHPGTRPRPFLVDGLVVAAAANGLVVTRR